MPKTSRSFHYWQLAPRWRLLLWLANLSNPAMRAHTRKGNKHPSCWINSGKKGEGMGKTAWMLSRHSSQRCKFMLKAHARTPQTKSTWNSNECAYAKTADCYRVLMLSVVSSNVNSIKLHLTAQNFGTDNWLLTTGWPLNIVSPNTGSTVFLWGPVQTLCFQHAKLNCNYKFRLDYSTAEA